MTENGTRDRRNGSSIAWAIAVLLATSFQGCRRPLNLPPSVHYRLPNDYRGVFKIILDEDRGAAVELKNGRYEYEIPASGVLRVKSFAPFRVMHEATAEYLDGRPIVIPDSTVGDDVVALRGDLGEYARGSGPRTIVILIGTQADVAKVRLDMMKPEFDKVPPER